jgi:tetratricopeptide (TPR) repeat protein
MTMKITTYFIHITICAALVLAATGCDKEFLESKPSSKIIQPQTLEELQLLMENMSAQGYTCDLPLISSDELEYISVEIWQAAATNADRNAYIWAKDLLEGELSNADWINQYKSIFYANNVLAGIEKINKNLQNEKKWNLIKGWALFCRAYAYFDLVKNYAPAYDALKASSTPGVPIRLNPSIDEVLPRATQQATYERIFTDLTEATGLLDEALPVNRNQPSKISSYALAARIYLSMGDYTKAEIHADKALLLYNNLIDYNIVSLTSASPFTAINTELLYSSESAGTYASLVTVNPALNTQINIPENIIQLYHTNDLRLPIYFAKRSNGRYVKKRGYLKTGLYPFTGLAVDELYLIKSECAARNNEITTSLKFLNDLLIKRFKTGTYSPITISDPALLLNKVLEERQKELIWRGQRWDDLKRLNKGGANITLIRSFNGQVYMLPPNDPRYVFPIPDNEINISGIQQNLR